MKSYILLILLVIFTFSTIGCGDNTPGAPAGPAVFEGVEMSLSEALELRLNQFYVEPYEGAGETVEFSVYIQNSATDEYIACVGPDNGLDVALQSGVYYGQLNIATQLVEGATDENPHSLIIKIYADLDNSCPTIPDENNLVLESNPVNFIDIIDEPIRFTDDTAIITFKGRDHDDVDIVTIPDAETDDLTIGELEFDDSINPDGAYLYYLVIYFTDDLSGPSTIAWNEMPIMKKPNVIYSWLNLTFDSIDISETHRNVRIVLKRPLGGDAHVVGITDPKLLIELGGGSAIKLKSAQGTEIGHIRFR